MILRLLAFSAVQVTVLSAALVAQQPSIGSIGVQDATVSGALEITNGRTVLVGSTTVIAKDRTAHIALSRGGNVLVCATSELHLAPGKTTRSVPPLMLALDRGAIEVQMNTTAGDVVITPDMRFAAQSGGPLDLKLRVTSNGDTCVENRGNDAPVLHIADTFGDSSYDLHAGQHVLFEHGSLKEVVDRESSPCGCPEPVMSVADAGATSATPAAAGNAIAATSAEVEHPFPAAVSQGLSPEPPVPAVPPGEVHAQVATTLSYNADKPAEASAGSSAGGSEVSAASNTNSPAAVPNAAAQPVASTSPEIVRAETPPPPAAPSAHSIMHRIGRFFKRIFGG